MTSEMVIMEKLVGGLIGKNGYNISRMRTESGATIKISGAKGEGEHRLIQFSGSAFQVSVARSMVEAYIFSQFQPQLQTQLQTQLHMQAQLQAQLQPQLQPQLQAQLQPQLQTQLQPQLQPQNPF